MNTIFSDQVVLVTELRKNLASYLEQARQGRPISIMQRNQTDIALIRRDAITDILGQLEKARQFIAELEAQVETYEILADADMLDKISCSEKDIVQDRFVTLDELQIDMGI